MVVILFLLCICISFINVYTVTDNNSIVITIDKVNRNNYDLVITVSNNEDIYPKCTISGVTKLIEKYHFSNRYYYVFKYENLKQFKEYEYICGNDSNKIIFPNNSKNTKIAAFGDWSECDLGSQSLKYLKNSTYDAIVQLGDLGYDLNDDGGKVGNDFMTFISQVTSRIPFMPAPGNHEARDDFVNFIKRYNLPEKEMNSNLYYSYRINNIQFISINSEMGLNNSTDADKERFVNWFNYVTNNSNEKFRIVYMHRPLYCSMEGHRCHKEADQLRSFFENLFLNKVDLVLAGHMHNYERSLPVYNKTIDYDSVTGNIYDNPKFPVYLICGSAGNREGQTEEYKSGKYSKFVSFEVGICELEINDDNIVSSFVDSKGNIIDKLIITKKNKQEFRIMENSLVNTTNINITDNIPSGSTINDTKKNESGLINNELKNLTETNGSNDTKINNLNDTNKNISNQIQNTSTIENSIDNNHNLTNSLNSKSNESLNDNITNENIISNVKDKDDENLKTDSNESLDTTDSRLKTDNSFISEEDDPDHEFREEDIIAKNAFIITIILLTIFILLFIYNIIRCYRRTTPTEKVDMSAYGELQVRQDDSIIDLTS